MVILFLYDTSDLGLFPETRVRLGVTTPVLQNYRFIPVSVTEIPPSERDEQIRQYIDRTDFLAIVIGTYTFMRPWVYPAVFYGFSKNRPMMAINQSRIPTGWERELTSGPSVFFRIRWVIDDSAILLSRLDNVADILWLPIGGVSRQSVHYRLIGNQGTLDDIAPMYDWVGDKPNENFPSWVARSIFLAGL